MFGMNRKSIDRKSNLTPMREVIDLMIHDFKDPNVDSSGAIGGVFVFVGVVTVGVAFEFESGPIVILGLALATAGTIMQVRQTNRLLNGLQNKPINRESSEFCHTGPPKPRRLVKGRYRRTIPVKPD